MRKIIGVFCLAWVLFSIIQTGGEVTNLKWRERLQKSPQAQQDSAGDILNQGARILSSSHISLDPKVTDLYTEENGLAALSFVYWLYPSKVALVPTFAQNPLTKSEAVSMQEFLSGNRSDVSIYVGDSEVFENNRHLLGEKVDVIIAAQSENQIVARISRR